MQFKYGELGSNVEIVCENENCSIYKVYENGEEGIMTMYQLFQGVYIIFNDFHMENCISQFQKKGDIFCIDHCKEGRIEWELEKNKFIYLKEGDMQLSTRKYHWGQFSFPLHHYHGVTICFVLDEAEESLSNVLDGFRANIKMLSEKFCSGDKTFIMRAGAGIEHIFFELYNIEEPLKFHYCQIKVLELLLFLQAQEDIAYKDETPYFYRVQVEKMKAIAALLTKDLERYYTLEELSYQFDIPLTSMKQCFKGVYGTSIYAYIKTYRMNVAANLLRTTKDSVAEIGGRVGYDNASKFSSAFKQVIGMTPLVYRKSCV